MGGFGWGLEGTGVGYLEEMLVGCGVVGPTQVSACLIEGPMSEGAWQLQEGGYFGAAACLSSPLSLGGIGVGPNTSVRLPRTATEAGLGLASPC